MRRVILADTASRIDSDATWNDRIARIRAGGMEAIREMVVGRFLSAPYRAAYPTVAAAITASLLATDPAGYIATCEALRAADLRPLVAGIRAPALVIAGALDESTPPAQSEELHAAIPGSRLVILSAAAHLARVERAEAFTELALAFLRED